MTHHEAVQRGGPKSPERSKQHEHILGPRLSAFALSLLEPSKVPPELSARFAQSVQEIRNPAAREKLAKIYERILAQQQKTDEKKEAILDYISEKTGTSRDALPEAIRAWVQGDRKIWERTSRTELQEGDAALSAFIQDSKKPYNLFYIDKVMPKGELKERATLLDELYLTFKDLPMVDKDAMQEVVLQMFGIPTVPDSVQSHLQTLETMSRSGVKSDGKESYRFSEGAENKNFIYRGPTLENEVLKLSKDRHDVDFTSVIKLMRDMHYLALHFDHDRPRSESEDVNVRIHTVFDDMIVYRDQEGNLKRLVRQEYAPGTPIKELQRDIMNYDPKFRAAWKVFLRQVEKMKDEYGLVLDITDSDAGGGPSRGNVANTGNIFVEFPASENDHTYQFHIIDPDVFDTARGEHKFDPKEEIRRKGIRGIMKMLKVAATNLARDEVVRRYQNLYVRRELSR